MPQTLPPLRLVGGLSLMDDRFSDATLGLDGGVISTTGGHEVDLTGYLVLPGIIDMHGDAFERHVAPRPSAPLTIASGLRTTDQQAASCGITTAWLAQCWSWEGGLRGPSFAEDVLAALDAYRPQALTDLRIQLRCETHLPDTRDRMLAAIRRHGIDYVVFNDHLSEALEMIRTSPHTLVAWAEREGLPLEEFTDKLHAARDTAARVPRHLHKLAEAFDTLGVTYGSHDDPDGETREYYGQMGARVAEFPTREEPARVAKLNGDPVVMGAPNVVRGGSQAGNIAAIELVRKGLCDALVSDYHYPCMADAAWSLVDNGVSDLAKAWRLISTNPADIMGLSDRGRLVPGQRADIVLMQAETRMIEGTISAGRAAYLSGALAERFVDAMAFARTAAE